jgi:hypothetical protein
VAPKAMPLPSVLGLRPRAHLPTLGEVSGSGLGVPGGSERQARGACSHGCWVYSPNLWDAKKARRQRFHLPDLEEPTSCSLVVPSSRVGRTSKYIKAGSALFSRQMSRQSLLQPALTHTYPRATSAPPQKAANLDLFCPSWGSGTWAL